MEDEDKRNEASGGGCMSGNEDVEMPELGSGTGEEPDNPFAKRSTKQKGHGKSKVTFENFEYIKVNCCSIQTSIQAYIFLQHFMHSMVAYNSANSIF